MSSISNDIYSESDINFLQNEKFDFDLAFSPTLPVDNSVEGKELEDDEEDGDDEVFFGPVGFTEQCMSTRIGTLQDEESTTFKPLSPLSGEQVVELFTEATKIALHIERLSTDASENSQNQSNTSSPRSSTSNSYLKLSNRSSTSSYRSARKSSSDDSEAGKTKSCSGKENIEPIEGGRRNSDGCKPELKKSKSKIGGGVFAPRQLNSPVRKLKKGIARLGSKSRLPRSKNTEKSTSAFSSPIKPPEPRFQNGVVGSTYLDSVDCPDAKNLSVEKNGRGKLQQETHLPSSQQKIVPSDTETPATTRSKKNSVSTALTKRNIFRSTESLSDLGAKTTKSKLPVSGLSKIPGALSQRRRSNSTSSLSSQSSTSSLAAQDEGANKPCGPTKTLPSTIKASLTSSLPLGLFRRSSKTKQESCADKKTQPVKALPRTDVNCLKIHQNSRDASLPQSDEASNESKVPLAATPVQPPQSSLPVVKRRSSIKRPATTGKKTIAAPVNAVRSLKKQNSSVTDIGTPKRPSEKGVSNLVNHRTRRSLLPTPSRDSSTKSRIPLDGPVVVPLKLAVYVKDDSDGIKLQDNIQANENTENILIQTDSPTTAKCDNQSTVDDLLQLDDAVSLMDDVVPMQPKQIPQADLIDLSDI